MWVMISPKGEGRGEGERRGLLSRTVVLIRCARTSPNRTELSRRPGLEHSAIGKLGLDSLGGKSYVLA